MAFSENSKFFGTYDGKDPRKLRKEIDYTITSVHDRVEHINDIIESSGFFLDYFEQSFKKTITSADSLSEENDVCQTLESMGTYILYGEEEVSDRKLNGYEYKADSQKFNKNLLREAEAGGFTEEGEPKSELGLIRSIRDEQNIKVVKPFRVEPKELKEVGLYGDILRDYQTYVDTLKRMIEEKAFPKQRLTKVISSVRDDMLMTKLCMKKCFGEQFNPQEMHNDEALFLVDMTNPIHVREFLKVYNYDGTITFENEMSIMYYDFYKFIQDIDWVFTDLQKEILRQNMEGASNKEIGANLNKSKQQISNTLNDICEKIAIEYDLVVGD